MVLFSTRSHTDNRQVECVVLNPVLAIAEATGKNFSIAAITAGGNRARRPQAEPNQAQKLDSFVTPRPQVAKFGRKSVIRPTKHDCKLAFSSI